MQNFRKSDPLINLINEISIICKRLKIDTYSVLEAASTKWNFVEIQTWISWRSLYGQIHITLLTKKKNINPD